MFGILEAVSVPHSGIFNSYEDLFKELSDRMEKDGYKIVKARSHRGKVGGADVPGNDIVRCDLVCDRGGRPYRCMATKHKTTTKKTDCPWKAKAVHRKTMGGWVLTITCDQHNHEPGTPEPPTPEPASEDETNIVEDLEGEQNMDSGVTPLLTEWPDDGPQPDAETQAAIHVAGVSNAVLRLTGDTFHQFKSEYRKMSQPERIGILSQLQLRIAAIYAVQNEDVQRQKRQEAQDKRHRQIEETKRQSSAQKQRARQRRQVAEQTQQQQPPPQMHPQHVQQQPLPQQTSQAQVQAQQAQQAQQAAQAQAQAQAMMQSQLYLPQNPQQTPIPVPGMDMPQFQHYAGPPKRMRGRPSQGGQQT
ncbi:uncharacterized protein NECHADRAFT_90666 [Fusarium vanettenii 77-13-4]|uniref:FAR1 domain-containing protein n=1 Tax=Fusarium vanettenii (strain ATCC MYA-4622 / CBS 123669 / FGSC 9596 / NRRL 45880 / 77-13-4) TaxID=660122 RepID=C7Z619_FUSV7|nr:uncharacterized protein NECHADRAFT_90666 [Fusarium vanettenii 77-13-4]EEU40623.1 hypothetical protein NECHADRAFT_90666 [Fusarium vanettenii 77-13-4]